MRFRLKYYNERRKKVFMTPHSLQIVHASLESLPVAAMSVSSTLMLTSKSSKKIAKEKEESTPLNVRATKLTSLLTHIHGYDHGGLNE